MLGHVEGRGNQTNPVQELTRQALIPRLYHHVKRPVKLRDLACPTCPIPKLSTACRELNIVAIHVQQTLTTHCCSVDTVLMISLASQETRYNMSTHLLRREAQGCIASCNRRPLVGSLQITSCREASPQRCRITKSSKKVIPSWIRGTVAVEGSVHVQESCAHCLVEDAESAALAKVVA
jgi:hypothetical protein